MSMAERHRLMESWKPMVREVMIESLSRLLECSKSLVKLKNDVYDEVRRAILRRTSVIGMTTSGAAKYQRLIEAVAPRIIICEEAGEVMESHILATLSNSTQHLILIGDHLQLRPQIQTYNLSSESTVGQHHNLDISLFERLVDAPKNPLPASELTVQRRMRPEISSLIRNTLYENLEDGENVHEYPNVSGMATNLHFMDHSHPIDSKDQFGPQSFSNTFEVNMVESLVHYLIKNGYDSPGDIAVLTPYLGQLSKLRSCLSQSLALVMNEQDKALLDTQDAATDHGDGKARAKVNDPLKNRINLQTIDNYQGEEANVVIISLVRSDAREDGTTASYSSIGFLKSPNRTNVLLSRARHGMYLIGNAHLMDKGSRSRGLWPHVVSELRESDRVSGGFPISCRNHPDVINVVTTPEMFRKFSPNGGCDLPCGFNLPCGHICPLQCHLEDRDHILSECSQPCMRLQQDCNHVCPKTCKEPCGDCMVEVEAIILQCGHVFEHPKCHQAKNPSLILCMVEVLKEL
ncbi:AAA domain-containing protein, partial [Mortierella sp. GBAus27b]